MGIIKAAIRLAEAEINRKASPRGDYYDDSGYGGPQGASRSGYYPNNSPGRQQQQQGYADPYNQGYGYGAGPFDAGHSRGGFDARRGRGGLPLARHEDRANRRADRHEGRADRRADRHNRRQHHHNDRAGGTMHPGYDNMAGPGARQPGNYDVYGTPQPGMMRLQQELQRGREPQQQQQEDYLRPEAGPSRQRAHSEGNGLPSEKNRFYEHAPQPRSREEYEDWGAPPPYEPRG